MVYASADVLFFPLKIGEEQKKGLHVRRSTIFPMKIGEEQKEGLQVAHGPQFASPGVEKIFYNFDKTSLFAIHHL